MFGVGNGDVKEELNKKYELINQDKFDLTDYNAHNQYLNELSTKGVFGGFALIVFLIVGMFYGIKYHNKLLFLLLLINSISFITENVLTRNKGILFLFYFYCLLISNLDFNLMNKKKAHESITDT